MVDVVLRRSAHFECRSDFSGQKDSIFLGSQQPQVGGYRVRASLAQNLPHCVHQMSRWSQRAACRRGRRIKFLFILTTSSWAFRCFPTFASRHVPGRSFTQVAERLYGIPSGTNTESARIVATATTGAGRSAGNAATKAAKALLGAPLDALAKGTGTVAGRVEVPTAASRLELMAWKEASRRSRRTRGRECSRYSRRPNR